MKLLILVLALIACIRAELKTYDGYVVLRATPRTDLQLAALRTYETLKSYNFWNEPRAVDRSVDIMVAADKLQPLREALEAMEMEYDITIEDVGALLRNQASSLISTRVGIPQGSGFSFHDYHRLDTIYEYLDELQKNENYSSVMKQEVTGHSVEGRPIRLVTLSKGEPKKKAIWVDGGIHAREWISPAVTLYLMTQVLQNQTLLEDLDFYFAPVDNPDGYEYTHTDDRFWRKNRSKNNGGYCQGVDLNRNFDHLFGGDGTSSNACSDIYHGPSAFSEPETRVMRDAILARRDTIKLLLTLHSYAQVVGVPYGDKRNPETPPDFQEMVALAQASANALYDVHGKTFKVGNTEKLLGAAAGATDDWSKKEAGIKYVYTVELRDTGRYGFALPADQIIPSGEEMWAFFQTACGLIINEN